MLPKIKIKTSSTNVQFNKSTTRLSLDSTGYQICAVITTICVLGWCWIAFQFSQASNPNFGLYKNKLEKGYFGRLVDNSDNQYASFRNHLPTLCAVVVIHPLISKVIQLMCKRTMHNRARIWTSVIVSVIFLSALHGTSALKVFILVSINYQVSKLIGASKAAPVFVWVYGISLLFLNFAFDGYRYASISPSLAPLDKLQGN
jgi:protein-cysteine N-palmitoyltransferase HHAT